MQALTAYECALEIIADDASLLTNIAATRTALGDYKGAASWARRATQTQPTWVKGYYRLSVALDKMGATREAMEACAVGLKKCGDVAQLRERYEGLVERMKKEEATPEEMKLRGNEFLREGENAAAIEAYTMAIDKGCDDLSVLIALHNNRAEARRREGDHDGVVEDCGTVLELDGDNLKALLRRAGTYETLERWRLARADYRRILEIDQSDPCRVRQRLTRCESLIE